MVIVQFKLYKCLTFISVKHEVWFEIWIANFSCFEAKSHQKVFNISGQAKQSIIHSVVLAENSSQSSLIGALLACGIRSSFQLEQWLNYVD